MHAASVLYCLSEGTNKIVLYLFRLVFIMVATKLVDVAEVEVLMALAVGEVL